MARAKQTTRAEARRRYRQTAPVPLEDGETSAAEPASAARGSSGRGTSNAGPARTGFIASFQKAYRRPQYREDLAALPTLLRGTWFLIGVGLVTLGFLAEVFFTNTEASNLLFSLLTVPPAMVPIFLIGFTAPRASYLLGLILGILDLILYVLFVSVFLPRPADESLPIGEVIFNGLLTGLPAAALFAAAAAFYRRFLALTSPRSARSSSGGRAKAANRAKAGRRY